jgi:hypothetical protein
MYNFLEDTYKIVFCLSVDLILPTCSCWKIKYQLTNMPTTTLRRLPRLSHHDSDHTGLAYILEFKSLQCPWGAYARSKYRE